MCRSQRRGRGRRVPVGTLLGRGHDGRNTICTGSEVRDMHTCTLLLVLFTCLTTACSSSNQADNSKKQSERWTPGTPEETRMLDAVTAENDGLEADKAKDWATAKERLLHAWESYQAEPGT